MEKVEISEPRKKLAIGVSCIDSLIGGGLESGVITEIYGEGGSGKTNLALLFSISCIRQGKRVIYIDTEGVSSERLSQISNGSEKLGENLILYRVSSLEDQELAIMRCEKLIERYGNVGLIVIDSFTEYFRLEKTSDAPARIAGFQKQLSHLSRIILKFNIPALITNQVYQDVDGGGLQPFGGHVINHAMKSILEVSKIDSGKRRLTVMKHRSIADGQFSDFRIASFGISCEA
ncbi:DNA repair and recombination protein RadB [Thermoplasmatales archaeon]|nr:DNA repair and recombination protein RadB [Thermoplasmatales archaeon]